MRGHPRKDKDSSLALPLMPLFLQMLAWSRSSFFPARPIAL